MFAQRATRQARLPRRIVPLHDGLNIHKPLSCCSQITSFSTTQNAFAKVPGSFADVRFSRMEVPQLDFWKNMAQPPLISGREPEEFFEAAHAYVDLAVANRPGWRDTLRDPPQSLSYPTLHYLAAMIMASPPGPAFHIALHIYQTLVMLDYSPSIITMRRLAFMRNKSGHRQFGLAEDKFASILRRQDDPNACALQGQILAAKLTPETDEQALKWFRKAASLGGEEPGAWDWQAGCALDMGKVYLRMNNPQRAKEIWKYCAEHLDVAEGAWLYSTLLDDSDPEKREWVCRAAVSGVLDATREMARLERLRAESQDAGEIGSWEKKASSVMQAEWEAIAGDRTVL